MISISSFKYSHNLRNCCFLFIYLFIFGFTKSQKQGKGRGRFKTLSNG